MRFKKAFTLIELLVVIAIIALLLSILLPSLKKAKLQAQSAICRSNLHQWGLIWRMYTEDHNGYFSSGDGVGWIRGQWAVGLRQYWQERRNLLTCPSAKKPQPGYIPEPRNYHWGGPQYTYLVSDGTDPDGNYETASYGMNNWVFRRPGGNGDLQGRPDKWHWGRMDVMGSSQIPLFLDSMWRGGGPFYMNGNAGSIRIKPPDFDGQWGDNVDLVNITGNGFAHEMKHFCIDRHSETVNGVFFDLSTRKIPLKHLWKLKWHKEFNTSGYPANGGMWPASGWMDTMKE